jgi:hypothetical protein
LFIQTVPVVLSYSQPPAVPEGFVPAATTFVLLNGSIGILLSANMLGSSVLGQLAVP